MFTQNLYMYVSYSIDKTDILNKIKKWNVKNCWKKRKINIKRLKIFDFEYAFWRRKKFRRICSVPF